MYLLFFKYIKFLGLIFVYFFCIRWQINPIFLRNLICESETDPQQLNKICDSWVKCIRKHIRNFVLLQWLFVFTTGWFLKV